MKKSNKMLAGLVIGTMAFAGLAAMPGDSASFSSAVQNIAYADVNTNNIKVTNLTYDYDRKIYTLEFTGVSAKNLGPVDDFVVVNYYDGGLLRRKLKTGDYSLEDKNGKMVVSFPGDYLKTVSIVFKDLYLGVNFAAEKGDGISVDYIQAYDLESYRKEAKEMLFGSIDRSYFNKKELDYINKIYARGDSVLKITQDYGAILKIFDDIAPTIDQMEKSGKYTANQMNDKTHELITKGLEKLLNINTNKQETPKKTEKKELSKAQKLRNAIEQNKITTKAAQLLLDTVPNLGKDLTQKLKTLMEESNDLVEKAEKMLVKLEQDEKAGK